MNSLPLFCSHFIILLTVLLTSLISPAYGSDKISSNTQTVQRLSLAGDITSRKAEISGLAWYGDYLILLPQYPAFPSKGGGGRLFALHKKDILTALDHPLQGDGTPQILTPIEIPCNAPDLAATMPGFDGYESIIFDGDEAFLTVEFREKRVSTSAILVKAKIATDLSRFDFEPISASKNPIIASQSHISNLSDEALILVDDTIISFHEANGKNVNASPVAHLFDKSLYFKGTIPFPNLPYRLTDATTVDEKNRFWITNYYYPGEKRLFTDANLSHSKNTAPVERLVEIQYNKDGFQLTDSAPIALPSIKGKSRNWEGIVRLDLRGFLIATDKYPTTILGFVKNP